jgi:signal transduction histidine kinase
MILPSITWRLMAWTGPVLWLLASLCAPADAPKRVMILNPYSRDTAPFAVVAAAFRSTLATELREPIDFQEIPLDLTRFSESGEQPLVAFLEERLAGNPVDLVVPIGGAGASFAARHHDRLFRETPIVLVGAEPRMIPPGFLGKNVTLVTQPIDLPGMIGQILAMKPETKRIAVVFGASEIERKWANECRREFASFAGRLEFIWLDDLTLADMLDRCSKLPPDTFIFHGLFIEDADGIPCAENQALLRLHEVANAPVFSVCMSEIGLGPVGGNLFRDTEVGEQAARAAARILRGESPEAIAPLILEPGTPVYDWRELRRWNIREANLPAEHIIRFREPGFWESYHWPVIGVASLALIQAALIAGLLINRAQRRRGEEATALIADISSKFVNLPASEVDREIHDAQHRICKLLGIDMSVLWQWDDHAPGLFTATHIHSLTGGPQPPIQMEADNFPWVRQEILSGRAVVLRSLDEMPDEASKDRETARRSGIRSSLSLPLSLGGDSPIGILCFNTTRKERSWPPDLVERLKLVAEIVANALARKKADHDLRESSEAKRLAMQQTMELRDTLAHTGRVSLLGQLASALAHELSQPLGAILRNAEAAEIMLQQAAPDIEELRAIVDDILRDDQRAGGVINKLRSLLGKGELKLEPLDLSEVISDVLALLQSDATVRHVRLDTDIEPGIPKILGDRIHLQQVLLNLIVNAIDALAEQDATDRIVRVIARMTDPATVEARVCDNGPGIPDDRLTRLFEPFYTTKATGMGMGLPVSKTIIEAHKGKLTAENRPNGGACFCFTLQTTLQDSTP